MLAHALALFAVWLTLVGLVGLTRRLGARRPGVTAALAAFGLAAAMISLSAIIDGLVTTRLAQAHIVAEAGARNAMRCAGSCGSATSWRARCRATT